MKVAFRLYDFVCLDYIFYEVIFLFRVYGVCGFTLADQEHDQGLL